MLKAKRGCDKNDKSDGNSLKMTNPVLTKVPKETYVGLTSTSFKTRLANHKASFNSIPPGLFEGGAAWGGGGGK